VTKPHTQQTPEQIAATDPAKSNWVMANAGSGKTHVLTHRVARLLLSGVAPEKILCLTYTKAAASEMQTRLFDMLGTWAMADNAELIAILNGLSGTPGTAPHAHDLAEARRLFARALETPGGLKIQTIHAFCDALLRRFPLEAGVSPRFEVLDERQAADLEADNRQDMALAAEAGTDSAFDRAAAYLNEGDIYALAKTVAARREEFSEDPMDDHLEAHFGPAAANATEQIAQTAISELAALNLNSLAQIMASVGGVKAERPIADALLKVFNATGTSSEILVMNAVSSVLKKNHEKRAIANGFPTVAVKSVITTAADDLDRLGDWARDTIMRFNAIAARERTADLHAFAGGLLPRYRAAKAADGTVDFNDLVSRARILLRESNMRAWVLYKLDQGIEHILVDEAQDTSPQQWDIIREIAEEFLAGHGARPEQRSIFVVGDEKQSIYSFQGADPVAFGDSRAHFDERLNALDAPLGQPELVTSFRSAPAILDFVDAVFAGDAAAGLTVDGTSIRHQAHRQRDHGRVDLWPLIEPETNTENPNWWEPVDAVPPTHHKERLARAVAEHVAELINSGTRPVRDGQPAKPVEPGDILILVSKRDRLATGIIRELKSRDVAVAGADRLKLTSEIAVQDLLALIKVCVMPADDLSLAALLRSPLFDVSEEALFDLAHGRDTNLWAAVQRADQHQEIATVLADMASQADFLRPYEFLERLLIRHDGRRKLIARLGQEAEDAIDELLAQALAFETRALPSLAGFVHWIEAGEISVKREMDMASGSVRVMTVHGAKGLEAPIVILPDTMSGDSSRGRGPTLLPTADAGNAPRMMLWAGSKTADDPVLRAAREAEEARQQAERRRLLYVALTRAEDWLILCGAGKQADVGKAWYGLLEAGMKSRADDPASPDQVQTLPSPTGSGEMRRFETNLSAQPASPTKVHQNEAGRQPLPDWLVRAPSEVRHRRLAPSALSKAGEGNTGGVGRGRELALRRGLAVHRLLEVLPSHEASSHAAIGQKLLDQEFSDLSSHHADIVREAAQVFAMDEADWIFATDTLAEVSAAIDVPGQSQRMIGRIDRVCIAPDHVTLVDFKTDPTPPDEVSAVQSQYIAQLGAYASVLRHQFVGHQIRLSLLWSSTPKLMFVDLDLAENAYKEAVASIVTGA
jgi:ATP-dependent helicase/nuclease subunit A